MKSTPDNGFIILVDKNEYIALVKADENGIVPVDNEIPPPQKSILYNFPNPFYSTTTIIHELQNNIRNKNLEIFNIKGQMIKFISCSNQTSVIWDGTDNNNIKVPSGIYLYRITSDNFNTEIKKMILTK